MAGRNIDIIGKRYLYSAEVIRMLLMIKSRDMNINEASNFFEDLLLGTKVKSESKLYQKYIAVLSSLKEKDLSEIQVASINEKIASLDLAANPNNHKKYLKQRLSELLKYLKDEYSFISEGYYTSVGIALGVAFGAAFGAAYNVGLGVALGMIIGLIIGANNDAQVEKEDRVLRTKIEE